MLITVVTNDNVSIILQKKSKREYKVKNFETNVPDEDEVDVELFVPIVIMND
jgi:hypothetical protein